MKKIIKVLIFCLCAVCLTCTAYACSTSDTESGVITSIISSTSSTSVENTNSTNSSIDEENDNLGKQVPIYQGMTVDTLALENEEAGVLTDIGNIDNNGKHKGWYKGDHKGKEDKIDKDFPFDELFPNRKPEQNIENEVKDKFQVVGPLEEIYYANSNQDVFVNIHIHNPDNFEILSFTLNGKKYSNYMFEEGSNLETLIIKCNIGEVVGVVEYTIDAIKYIDGTKIKDVVIGGDKVVRVGVKNGEGVNATLADVVTTTNSIAFNVEISDKNNLIKYFNGVAKAVLYNGETLVAHKDLVVGKNQIVFDNLKENTLYQYAIVAYYDDLNGADFGMHMLIKDVLYTKSSVLFDDIVIDSNKIDFGFIWDSAITNKIINAIKLFKDGSLIKEFVSSTTQILELLSNTEYKIVVEYDNFGKSGSITLEFATASNEVPTMGVEITNVTQTSVNYNVTIVDQDNVGQLTKVRLLHEDESTEIDVNLATINNLLSNNTYTLEFVYTYNLQDGQGNKKIVKRVDFTTDKKAVPEVSILSLNSSDTFSGEYSVVDTDNTLISCKVSLYDGEQLIEESLNKVFEFTSYNSSKEYKVVLEYVYDLNDGQGQQTQTIEFTTETSVIVKDFKVINTSAVSEGERIYFQGKLNNLKDYNIKSVVINGTEYEVSSESTKERFFVEILHSNQFKGGETLFTLEKIFAEKDGETIEVEVENSFDSVFINGILEVLSIEVTDANFNPIGDWVFPKDVVYLVVHVDNPTGYNVDKIDGLTSQVKKIDNNTFYCELTLNSGWNTFSSTTIMYSNNYITKEVKHETIYAQEACYQVASNEIKYISTPTDLLNMGEGYYYQLKNNIDLVGMEWKGASFTGVFNGNGYSIKNASMIGTILNDNAYLGLFSSTDNGVVENLTLASTTYIVEMTKNDSGNYYAYCGGLFATASGKIVIDNCVVDSDSVLKVSSGISYVGGFIGYDEGYLKELTIKNSENSASINGSQFVGGFIGGGYQSVPTTKLIFDNCVNNGSINVARARFVGGFIGCCFNCDIAITDCVNNGKITVTESADNVGGFIGCSYESSPDKSATIIINSENKGEINVAKGAIGGIVASVALIEMTNCSNSGNIYSSSTNFSSVSDMVCIGGLIGSGNRGTLDGCYNNGKIESQAIGIYVAGIIGKVVELTIIDCVNNGDIVGPEYVGGIFAVNNSNYYSYNKGSVINCKNNGDLTGKNVGGVSAITPGGEAPITIEGFVNTGTITATENAGGIIATGNCIIKDCLNTGDINGANAGGFIGDASGDLGLIKNSVNTGTITGSANAGGFFGIGVFELLGGETEIVSNCINNGNVSAPNAGGFIGQSANSMSSRSVLLNCLNTGNITGNSYLGGFLGVETNRASLNVANCVNAGSIQEIENAKGFVGGYDGDYYVTITETNCYSVSLPNTPADACTLEQLNTKSFYVDTLGWSEDVWDFSNIDVQNGKYPTLKITNKT